MNFCFSRKCCFPPTEPYTTARYVGATGERLWTADYFQWSESPFLVGYPRAIAQCVCQDVQIVVVGGSTIGKPNPTPVFFWNVVGFDATNGDQLWDRNISTDITPLADEGYYLSGGDGLGVLGVAVRQIVRDPASGNVVCFAVLNWKDSEDFLQPFLYFVVLDPETGDLVSESGFKSTAYDAYHHYPEPKSFAITSSGEYHILCKSNSVRGDSYYYAGSPPFSSAPTLHGPAGVSSAYPTSGYEIYPYSIMRFGDTNYVGGQSVFSEFGTVRDVPEMLSAAYSMSDVADSHEDWESTFFQVNGYSDDVLNPSGNNQVDATLMSAGKNYSVGTPSNAAAAILTSGSPDQKIKLQPADTGGAPLYVRVYPPAGGTIVVDMVQYLGVNQPVDVYYGYAQGGGVVHFICYETGKWLLMYNNSYGMGLHMPYVRDGVVYLTGAYVGYITKWTAEGGLRSWTDCRRTQVIADSSGNTFGTGPREIFGFGYYSPTLTARDADGNYLWGHFNAGVSGISGRVIDFADDEETELIVTGEGSWLGGPVSVGSDRNYIGNVCPDARVCTGSCYYYATNPQTTYSYYKGSQSFRFTATENCQLAVRLKAGSGAGQGGGAGGGGGEGQTYFNTFYLRAGTDITFVIGGGGTEGRWDTGDGSGTDGENSTIVDMSGTTVVTVWSGKKGSGSTGGKGGGNTVLEGGGPGFTNGANGANAGSPTAQDGGNGGNSSGSPDNYGMGGRWTSYPTTGTVATNGFNGDAEDGALEKAGGGGGSRALTLFPEVETDAGVSGAGSPGYLELEKTIYDWALSSEESTCEAPCGCPSIDFVYQERGRPFTFDQVTYLNCW